MLQFYFKHRTLVGQLSKLWPTIYSLCNIFSRAIGAEPSRSDQSSLSSESWGLLWEMEPREAIDILLELLKLTPHQSSKFVLLWKKMYLNKVIIVVTVNTWEKLTLSLKNAEAICLPAPWKVSVPSTDLGWAHIPTCKAELQLIMGFSLVSLVMAS